MNVEKLHNDGKKYWTIGEMSREFKVTARALRFYEDRGLIEPIREGLNRKYTARDRARLLLVLRGKRVGLPLDEIRELLNLYDMEGGKRQQMEIALGRFRSQINVLENQKNDIEQSILQLKSQIVRVEQLLANLDDKAPQLKTSAKA